MNKIILLFTVQALASSAWALTCVSESFTAYPILKNIEDKRSGPFSPDALCQKNGYDRAATANDFSVVYSLQLPKETGLNFKFTNADWMESLKASDNICDPQTTSAHSEFLNTLKEISGKMTCNNIQGASTPGKLKHTKDSNFFNDYKLSKVSACVCISQDGAPESSDEAFEKEFRADIKNYINEEDIGGLVPARLYQFSLEDNVLDISELKACNELANDKELGDFVDKKLQKIAPAAKKLFGKMGQADALDVYNLGRGSSDAVNNKSVVPIISEAAFRNFSEQWGSTLGLSQISGVYPALKNELCSFANQNQREYYFNSANVSVLGDIFKRTTKQSEQTPDLDFEKAYLEKMLCSQVDKGVLLIDVLKDAVTKTSIIPTEPAQAFKTAFKKIITKTLEDQCKSSREHLTQLSKGDISAILNNNKFIEKRLANNPMRMELVQRYQCSMMQQQLENNPEQFLKDFCDHNPDDILPPKNCLGIGDFIKSQFIQKEGVSTSASGTVSTSVASIIEDLNDAESSKSAVSSKVSNVHVQHAATLSTIIKSADNFMGPPQNGKVAVNLDAYDVSRNKSLSFTDRPEKSSAAADTAEKPGIFSSFFNKNESAQATAASSQEASNVAPSEMFNNTAHQTAYQAPSIAPLTTYQQTTIPTVAATPQPVSAPVVSTTVIEKVVTPVAKVNQTKQVEDEEEEVVETKVTPKKGTPAISNNTEEETKFSARDFIGSTRSFSAPQSVATANSRMAAPSFQEASRNPSVIPDESVRSYIEARKFERGLVKGKDAFDTRDEGMSDPTPPETGLILNAFRTGKIGNKNVTKVALGDDIKDLSTFEKSGTFHGSVVIVEDKAKKERYICRALVNDAENGAEKLLPVEANALGKNEMAGYKCTTETTTAPAILAPLATAEKKAAQKALSGNERLYKAFVLDKIVQGAKKTK